jgi:hypothetical protein
LPLRIITIGEGKSRRKFDLRKAEMVRTAFAGLTTASLRLDKARQFFRKIETSTFQEVMFSGGN